MSEGDEMVLRLARQSAERALEIDSSDANAHHAMAMVAEYSRELDRAGLHFERAMTLNPMDVRIRGDRAHWSCHVGRLDQALQSVTEALQRDAFAPLWLWGVRGKILFHQGRYREAAEAFGHVANITPIVRVYLAATLALTSDTAGAAREGADILAALPGSTITTLISTLPYADSSMLQQLQDGLRKAGVPD
jgi:adenylate cyclase